MCMAASRSSGRMVCLDCGENDHEERVATTIAQALMWTRAAAESGELKGYGDFGDGANEQE